jgi:hypothetical protein
MERINKPQIRVNSTSHRAATKAAAACHLTVAREGQLIMQQVKKLGDRVFGYLQEEERSLLIPMLEEMLRSRITLERVLRLNEILVNQLTQQLSGYTEHQLAAQRESLQQLRQQNEAMIERQVNDAVASARATASGQPTRPSR